MTTHISTCGKYRHWLYRDLEKKNRDGGKNLCFIMLNPSTADAEKDDQTIRKCKGFALRL